MLNDERKPFIYNTNYCVLQVERRMIALCRTRFSIIFVLGHALSFIATTEMRKVDIVHTGKSCRHFVSPITALSAVLLLLIFVLYVK